jgi:ethanolamine transporter EutH
VALLMDQVWPIMAGVLLANGFSVLFAFGLWRVKNEQIDGVTFFAMALPVFMALGALFAY